MFQRLNESGISKISLAVIVLIVLSMVVAASYIFSYYEVSPGSQYLAQCDPNHDPFTTFTNTSRLETFSVSTMRPDDIGKFCASYYGFNSSSFQLNLANKWSVFYADNKSAVSASVLRISV